MASVTPTIERVAVVGAGIMGGGVAAFFANAGKHVSLFDVERALADKALDVLADGNAKLPQLYTPRNARLIQACSIKENAAELAKADVIVEVVPEVMSIKRTTLAEIDRHRRPGSIVCTNTSGLGVAAMAAECSGDLKASFLGTHFFNPVRYLPLVELIPTAATRPELVATMRDFFVAQGKRPVVGRDTPNFIANRIGVFQLMLTLRLMERFGLSVEQVDMITGPPLGNPKTATLRLADMIGIDTLVHAAANQYAHCPQDEARDVCKANPLLDRMVAEKRLGDKTRQGFYRKEADKNILALDLARWEYRPKTSPRSDVVRVAKSFAAPEERIAAMIGAADDPVGQFSRHLVLASAAYALNRVGEVADELLTIDNAVRWGFAKEIGPIETLDSLGLERSARMMEEIGVAVPRLLAAAISSTGRLCQRGPSATKYFDAGARSMRTVPERADVIRVAALRDANRVVRENLSARLLDIGDGVLLLDLDAAMVPTMNPIDDYMVSMLGQVFQEIPRNFRALVIGNQAPNFSAGAQLKLLVEMFKARRFEEVRKLIQGLQGVNLALYHAGFPVVTAPHGMTLGGGLEVSLAGHVRVAHVELYAGLVEVGVGVVPAGGGCLQLLAQTIEAMAPARPGPMPPVMRVFELIGYGKVSKSAHDAVELGLLSRSDVIVFNKDEQLSRAKAAALDLLDGFKPRPQRSLPLPGPGGYLVFDDQIASMLATKKITEHSALIARQQARILTGGASASPAHPVDERTVLELEMEAFLSLCGTPATIERIEHMLKTGKPLLN
jgi:3-hydroxyacyl-CoA dehydrogenase